MHNDKETTMEQVMLPKGTILHANGMPVELRDDTVILCAHENMQFVTGYHVTPGSMPPSTDDKPVPEQG